MGQWSFLGDVIAADEWQVIQEQLAEAMQVEVHTLGPDGADLCPPSRVTRFRQVLATSPAAQARIPDGRLDVVQRAGRRGELLVEETATGRLRFSVPVFFYGEQVATVSGGGVVAQPLSEAQVRALASAAELPYDELELAAAELRVADRDVCYAAGSLIASLLAQIVSAVEHRRSAELQALRIGVLARVGRIVTDSLDLERVMDAVVEAVPQVMDARACLLSVVDDDGVLRARAATGLGEECVGLEYRPGEGLAGLVLATGEPVNAPDLLNDPRSRNRNMYRREGLRSQLSVPLRDGDAVIGVVSVLRETAQPFGDDDLQVLANFADYTAAALRNAQLYRRMRQAYRELGVATRRLREAQDQVLHSDRLAEVGRLAGGAAHEMKNTLGGIIGAAATVRDQLDSMSDDDVRELVAAIATEGWRLRDTLEDVRSYAKPRHYGVGRQRLADVIAETLRLLRFDAKFRSLPVTVECDPEIEFLGDRDRCKQILLNLLRNAGDAVAGTTDREPAIRVAAQRLDGQVRLAVSDNGVGIAPEHLERIWEPFFTTKGAAGTGLGLDLVRQMLAAQGGGISVESTLGVGTTFTLTLPAAPGNPSQGDGPT